jgi:hypothetical protein
MSMQFAPAVSHLRHWYAYEIGCVPDQAPGSAVNVSPSCAVPEIVGTEVFAGGDGAACTTSVAAEEAVAAPAAFDAVTVTRMVEPTSAAVSE